MTSVAGSQGSSAIGCAYYQDTDVYVCVFGGGGHDEGAGPALARGGLFAGGSPYGCHTISVQLAGLAAAPVGTCVPGKPLSGERQSGQAVCKGETHAAHVHTAVWAPGPAEMSFQAA